MVCDFFYPNMGGIESHLYLLSLQLFKRGHKVVIVTHGYGGRKGVRYLTTGVKVYHVPHWIVYDQVSLPTLYAFFPLFRHILLREGIEIVHGHQAFSSMCHEAILHARALGLKTCFTDHSLFGFADASSILTNKLLKFTLSDIDHVICVSNTSKENTVLRASLDPSIVSVIPNAVVAADFTPDPSKRDPGKITIVVASRLVFRKGTDLLVAIIPRICSLYPSVQFIIGGDGPKRVDLEQMREEHGLQERVQVLGSISYSQVREVLVQGDIFLNTSLTEAFCIAIVEAACCGLLVVSTKVGGIPEVLPDDMVMLSEPTYDGLVETVVRAIDQVKRDPPDLPFRKHERIRAMYSWADVAERTERVYAAALELHTPDLYDRLLLFNRCGAVAGKLACMIIAVHYWIGLLLEYLVPRGSIEPALDFKLDKFRKVSRSLTQRWQKNESCIVVCHQLSRLVLHYVFGSHLRQVCTETLEADGRLRKQSGDPIENQS
ncbi:uncharacterized protein BJ171DRAFT_419782 [Polychytrium aggregatum]|uniref:uncharacterized protein n=1 Tax=Polychytrium aggregatum TaxID=110093 RepID=UPI0022FE687B|nr:uncharacterized protein BJ171DRAFT_419782 [Polychytrium aggregatum]KAI9208296.1 hypothetical protein BJ171DRAFT_419782 [Polychytrium aggregatum]